MGEAMDFRLRKQKLLEHAEHTERKAMREKNVQVQDVLRALALLYREMAQELEQNTEASVIPSYMH